MLPTRNTVLARPPIRDCFRLCPSTLALAVVLLPTIAYAADGIFDLGTLGGTNSWAAGVSADGNVVVGGADTTNNAAYHAFRWTPSGGMADLGTLGGRHSGATAVSADGNVVVGWSDTHTGFRHGFRWSAASTAMEEYPSLFSKWGAIALLTPSPPTVRWWWDKPTPLLARTMLLAGVAPPARISVHSAAGIALPPPSPPMAA